MDSTTCVTAAIHFRGDELLILVMGMLAIFRTPTDVFPNINIPVVSIIWNYNGLVPKDMNDRNNYVTERALTTTVDNIEHIESQSKEITAALAGAANRGRNLRGPSGLWNSLARERSAKTSDDSGCDCGGVSFGGAAKESCAG